MTPSAACRSILVTALVVSLAACGDGGSAPGPTGPGGVPSCAAGEPYESTFAAIQQVIFERHGCTQSVCHGSSAQGGLDLSSGAAYTNLVDVPANGSTLARVVPGDKNRSFLWQKLAAKTLPGTVSVTGSPMPSGLPAIGEDALEALRLWIVGGAPETGTVAGTEALLGACLPAVEPQPIKPLEPPPAGAGIQLVMPEYVLPAGSEVEYCFASYFDVTDQVPPEFRDPTGTRLRFRGQELRQDAQSHHLILNLGDVDPGELDDPSFGAWTCKGGDRAGETCDPLDLGACGAGLCGSEPQPTFACIGFGPHRGASPRLARQIGGAQSAQAVSDYYPGVYAEIPMKGVLYWNSHAFNLTTDDAPMHARLNYTFATDQTTPLVTIFDTSAIFAGNAAPYTTQTVCNDHVLPRGARLFELASHVHRFGKHFWIDAPGGERLYDSYVYNDPVYRRYDPPLAFDGASEGERTLRYCVLYNNGLGEDGAADPETVARKSRMPDPSLLGFLGADCRPTACATGEVGAPCAGVGDDASCDSSPGAGDGWCDACPITGGETTQNEMFILLGQYFVATP